MGISSQERGVLDNKCETPRRPARPATHGDLVVLLGHVVEHVEKCFYAKFAQMRLAKAGFWDGAAYDKAF